MVLLIVGSRSLTDMQVLRAAIRTSSWDDPHPSQILASSTPGVSRLAERYARENWISFTRFAPDRARDGLYACAQRDARMMVACTHVLLVLDNHRSPATYWRALATRWQRPLFLYYAVNRMEMPLASCTI